MDQRRTGTLLLMAALGLPEDEAYELAGSLLDKEASSIGRARLKACQQVLDFIVAGAEPVPICEAVVTAGRVCLHLGRGTGRKPTGTLHAGDVVRVWQSVESWSFLSELEGGEPVAGWAPVEALKAAEGEQA